jgi:cobyrinic acid a,c-diamide synthase
MRPATRADAVGRAARDAELVIAEGVMGLFDGAVGDAASTAEAAARTGWPVVLVVDTARQAHSVAALVAGFRDFRRDIALAGVILNGVGSDRHAAILRSALAGIDVPVLGALPRQADMAMPERHLGLVPAGEHPDLVAFLERAAGVAETHIDLARLRDAARPALPAAPDGGTPALPPLGQRIAVARDAAFCFAYPHLLDAWHAAGAEIAPFSPLADEAPPPGCDAVYLPGGYPELHAGTLAATQTFRQGMQAAARSGARVYGECGGYMTLGETLTDADGTAHRMLGLLPVATSFAEPRLHLGYRTIRPNPEAPLPWGGELRGHEFHYARILAERPATPFAHMVDAHGADLGPAGAVSGRVAGSFAHVIDAA